MTRPRMIALGTLLAEVAVMLLLVDWTGGGDARTWRVALPPLVGLAGAAAVVGSTPPGANRTTWALCCALSGLVVLAAGLALVTLVAGP